MSKHRPQTIRTDGFEKKRIWDAIAELRTKRARVSPSYISAVGTDAGIIEDPGPLLDLERIIPQLADMKFRLFESYFTAIDEQGRLWAMTTTLSGSTRFLYLYYESSPSVLVLRATISFADGGPPGRPIAICFTREGALRYLGTYTLAGASDIWVVYSLGTSTDPQLGSLLHSFTNYPIGVMACQGLAIDSEGEEWTTIIQQAEPFFKIKNLHTGSAFTAPEFAFGYDLGITDNDYLTLWNGDRDGVWFIKSEIDAYLMPMP